MTIPETECMGQWLARPIGTQKNRKPEKSRKAERAPSKPVRVFRV